MATKIGINGFGRIGRNVLRAASEMGSELEVVAVNDIGDPHTFAHLLKHDTAMGTFGPSVEVRGDTIVVDGRPIRFLSIPEVGAQPWGELGAEIVLESTGHSTDAAKARAHIDRGGARKVVISAPAKNHDTTLLMGVNHCTYDPARHHVVSMGSCTTNCLVPVVKVIHEAFGIEHGMMTTVHAYTGDQRLQDQPHKDLRRARAAADNIIPTSTGANRAVAEVLPELAGRFAGMAFRVPVQDVSVVDLSLELTRPTNAEAINTALEAAAAGPLRGILAVTREPLVSSDFLKDPHSSIVDAPLTLMLGDRAAKVVAWYDNEWGFSCRMVDLLVYLASRG
ncbi:MAG TPA: type I glyceraldehyde-3-phosphate dehydrogenase [Candidatus Dormibacteraeota bacterium]|jgi:glyceraldehyde 3-phosphate dehydrogenase